MPYAIKAQEANEAGEWNTIPDFGTFTDEYPTALDAILWARENMSDKIDGMVYFRWAVVNTENGLPICTV